MNWFVVGLALLLTSCSLAPSDKVMEALGQSERSWCIVITSVYGTGKFAGSGIHGGAMSCTNDGLTVRTIDPASVVVPITVTPQFSVGQPVTK